MVARSPQNRQRKPSAAPISPGFLRETVKKVDKCMARLEELQSTVKGYNQCPNPHFRNSNLRCRLEPIRMKTLNLRRSPTKKVLINKDDWQSLSLPAMLLGSTMEEILQANQIARKAVDTISSNTNKPPPNDDPKTPMLKKLRSAQPSPLNPRRTREKQQQKKRGESNTPLIHIAKSRINFKPISPECCNKENCKYIANRISPKNRPWVKKSVLFPNPLFHDQKFCKTKSPIIVRKQQQNTPHKFLIKSPATAASIKKQQQTPHKFQMKIRISPPRAATRRSSSARKSFSPSSLVKRLVSPLKSRNSVQEKNERVKILGLRQRPNGFSPRRI